MNALFTIKKSTFVATVQLLFMNSSCKPPKSKSKTRAKKKKKKKSKMRTWIQTHPKSREIIHG